jgi:ribosylpyrimidine nucleosidase
LDCDPGHDDALAIIIAANYIKDSLKAITTVAGNTSVDNTTNNALKICSFFGFNKINIYKGMPSGIINTLDYSEGPLHGNTGIDGFDFPSSETTHKKEHAVDFLRNLLSSSKSKIDLIATGPLTNLGILFSLAPETLNNINRLIIMGGCIGLGNRTPAAEFNIWADPEAAHIVFNSGIEIKIVPLGRDRHCSRQPA